MSYICGCEELHEQIAKLTEAHAAERDALRQRCEFLEAFVQKVHDVPPIGVEEIRLMQKEARALLPEREEKPGSYLEACERMAELEGGGAFVSAGLPIDPPVVPERDRDAIRREALEEASGSITALMNARYLQGKSITPSDVRETLRALASAKRNGDE